MAKSSLSSGTNSCCLAVGTTTGEGGAGWGAEIPGEHLEGNVGAGMLDSERITWGNDAVGMPEPRRTPTGVMMLQGLLDPTRTSCEEDARPQENVLGGRCCRDLEFGRVQRKAPCGSALASKGYTAGLSPGDFTLGWKGMVQPILLNRHGSRGESPASTIAVSSQQSPRRNGYFWASPRAIKSPVGAGTAVLQQQVMLPSPSRHKHPE